MVPDLGPSPLIVVIAPAVVAIATALELSPYEGSIVTIAGNATVFIAIDFEGTASETISRSLKKGRNAKQFQGS